MMEYNTFKEVISERICDYLPPVFNNYYPVIESVAKVNEKKEALTLRCDDMDERMAMPVLYLDDMYDVFKVSEDLDDLLICAAEIIVNFAGMFQDTDGILDIERQKDNIIPNLINTEANEDLLKDVPYMTMLDMSVIYRIMVESSDGGYDSCVITNRILEDLGISQKELHELAMNNMKRVLPLEISRISREDDCMVHGEIPPTFTFVSSNQRLYGATYMLFKDVMKDICRDLKTNRIYILPFSINEICITPAYDDFLEMLQDILQQSNLGFEYEGGFLSNNIYCFDKKKGGLSKVSARCVKKGLN